MTTTKTSTRYAGAPFPILGILGVLFITFKLAGVIAWPWVWVLAPFWVPLALVAAFFVFIVIVSVVSVLIEMARERE